MKTKLLMLVSAFAITFLNAQEVIELGNYNGSGFAVDAVTATVNNDITIVFEDVDIINNFYTDGQNSIWMYGGLDTDSGPFQDAPNFSNLSEQPQFSLFNDTNVNQGPNTYTLTINPATLYSNVPNGTTVYGLNLLFQNQYGGGGNNQTANLYINLVDAIKSPTLSTQENNIETSNTYMVNNVLHIDGYIGKASVTVYDILGRQTQHLQNITVNNGFKQQLNLPNNQLSVIVVRAEGFTKTIKAIKR